MALILTGLINPSPLYEKLALTIVQVYFNPLRGSHTVFLLTSSLPFIIKINYCCIQLSCRQNTSIPGTHQLFKSIKLIDSRFNHFLNYDCKHIFKTPHAPQKSQQTPTL